MDNNVATKPYSPLKGDPYRAFESLPTEVRRALQESLVDWCPLRAREWLRQAEDGARLRPSQAASLLVQAIRRMDHAEVAAFARSWPAGAAAYPHVAAEATLQRYAGRAGIPAPPPPRPLPKKPAAAKPAPRKPAAKKRGRR